MYFYELHEGDDEVYSDIILAREEEMAPDLFFETVQHIRRRVQETFEQDTLIEAIAEELEREHGFIFVSDDRLTAAVNVSTEEDENFLADLSGEDELDEEFDQEGAGFRTIIADFRGNGGQRPH